jgi:uncharacterized protein (TIGR02611 family)
VADRLRFRDRLRKSPALNMTYRIGIGVLGVAVILLGLLLVPLPGPGWFIVFLGLGILATEFAWAERLLDFGNAKLRAWLAWVNRQHLAVRALITLATLAFVAGVVVLTLSLSGHDIPFVGR